MEFHNTGNCFNSRGTWGTAIENQVCPRLSKLAKFDQSGYDLCELEQEYAQANNATVTPMRWRQTLRQDWFEPTDTDRGVHINHADLYERKGYHGYALEQLNHWADGMPILYKMSKLIPKWGIDISLDYVDNSGNLFELFHYEWDDHDLNTVLEVKQHIEQLLITTDWEHFAQNKIKHRDEWQHLDFVGQSEWTTQQLNLPAERFKLVPWRI